MHAIKATKKIKTPCQDIRKFIWEVKTWASFWEPLQVVHILYDDGRHQDFTMSLTWQNRDACIRTVRFCHQDGNISFFSPQPPPPTTLHHGSWEFVTNEDETVELTATRLFELPMLEKENFETYSSRLKTFSEGFQMRLEALLNRLGAACEK